MIRNNFIFVALLLGATVALPSFVHAASPKADVKSPRASFQSQMEVLRDQYFEDCGIVYQIFDNGWAAVGKAVKSKWKKASAVKETDADKFCDLTTSLEKCADLKPLIKHKNNKTALAVGFATLLTKKTKNSTDVQQYVMLEFFRCLLLVLHPEELAKLCATEKAAVQADADAVKEPMQVASAAGADGDLVEAIVAAVVAEGSDADVAAVSAQLAATHLSENKLSAAAPAEQPTTPPAATLNPRQLSRVSDADDDGYEWDFDERVEDLIARMARQGKQRHNSKHGRAHGKVNNREFKLTPKHASSHAQLMT